MATAIQGEAVKYLLTIPELVAEVGKFTLTAKPFIFRDEMLVNLEDNQYSRVSAVVVEDAGPLTLPGLTRFRSRRIGVTIWANGDRDAMGNLVNPSVVNDKIETTFKVIDKYLHRTNPQAIYWGTTLTEGSERLGDLGLPVSIVDGDGIKAATVYYAVFF